jgi:hypothetical protein
MQHVQLRVSVTLFCYMKYVLTCIALYSELNLVGVTLFSSAWLALLQATVSTSLRKGREIKATEWNSTVFWVIIFKGQAQNLTLEDGTDI